MKRNKKTCFGIVGALCFSVLFFVMVMQLVEAPTTDEPLTETEQVVQFPYELEDGKLQILSLFQSSVSNPDSDGSYVEDLAALEITNCSSMHLKTATIEVTMNAGETLTFVLEEIPADKTVWVFEANNKCYDTKQKCVEIKCTATFTEKTVLLEEQLHIKAEETLVMVTNVSNGILENLELEFHCLFEDVYYGGKTYKYHLNTLKVEEAASIDVWECYLGVAEIVNIEQ